jgi:CRISPR-associated protein Cmr1
VEKITYKLKMVTPVYCKGFDNREVELRPASFKGMIRYWYRALNAKKKLNELHNEENEIFGSTLETSKFAIRIKNINRINKEKNNLDYYYLSPHKKNVRRRMLQSGLSFNLELVFRTYINEDLISKVKDVFTLSLLLGGIGQRSRRGFGSIEDKDWEFDNERDLFIKIANILRNFDRQVEVGDGKYIKVVDNHRYYYPVIKEIYIGKHKTNFEDLLTKIGQATKKDKSLGSIKPRMASPVYVTVVKIKDNYYPLITKLEPNYPEGIRGNVNVLNKFINELRWDREKDI